MSPEESPELKYDRLKRQLQETILTQYPNPARKGCPGQSALIRLAAVPLDESTESDPAWHHATHCSECYGEYLKIRRDAKARAKARSKWMKLSVAAAILLLAVGLYFASGFRKVVKPAPTPAIAEVAYSKMTIDIPSMTRSENARASSPIAFDRKPLELTVNLPVGSKAGEYEFRFLKDDQAVASAHAEAQIRKGVTAFAVKIDLSKVPAGDYAISVRNPPWDWNYFPAVVR
jgi:hypothetical protein